MKELYYYLLMLGGATVAMSFVAWYAWGIIGALVYQVKKHYQVGDIRKLRAFSLSLLFLGVVLSLFLVIYGATALFV